MWAGRGRSCTFQSYPLKSINHRRMNLKGHFTPARLCLFATPWLDLPAHFDAAWVGQANSRGAPDVWRLKRYKLSVSITSGFRQAGQSYSARAVPLHAFRARSPRQSTPREVLIQTCRCWPRLCTPHTKNLKPRLCYWQQTPHSVGPVNGRPISQSALEQFLTRVEHEDISPGCGSRVERKLN